MVCWSNYRTMQILSLFILGALAFVIKISPIQGRSSRRSSQNALTDVNSNDIQSLINDAFSFHKNGQYEQAIQKYEDIIPMVQGTVASTLHSNLASLYMNKDDNKSAKKHFMSAVSITPENAQNHYNLAIFLTSKENDHTKALRHAKMALKLDPNNYKIYHLLGNILLSLNQEDEAYQYFMYAEQMASNSKIGDANTASSTTTRSSADTQDKSQSQEEDDNNKVNNRSVLSRLNIMHSQIGDTITINIHTTPKPSTNTDPGNTDNITTTTMNITCISTSPLMFYIPYLLSSEDCDAIIQRSNHTNRLEKSYVMGKGYTSSTTTTTTTNDNDSTTTTSGEKNHETLTSNSDTSTTTSSSSSSTVYRDSYNTWLSSDYITTKLHIFISEVTKIPLSYITLKSEELQVVKYIEKGHFNIHHDSTAFHPRLLTALVYLNDVDVDMDIHSNHIIDENTNTNNTNNINHDNTHRANTNTNNSSRSNNNVIEKCSNNKDLEYHKYCRRIYGGTWFPYTSYQGIYPPSDDFHSHNCTTLSYTTSKSEYSNSDVILDRDKIYTMEQSTQQALLKKDNFDNQRITTLPGTIIIPKKGSGILFFNYNISDEIDIYAVHAGLPLSIPITSTSSSNSSSNSGSSDNSDDYMSERRQQQKQLNIEKWIANYWITFDPKLLNEYLS